VALRGIRDYQVDGVRWLLSCWREGHGSILADEMGLGKTIQLLAFLSYLVKNTDRQGPFLVTVRTNTFKQWCDEIEKWTDLNYVPYSSGPAQRAMLRQYQFPFLDELGQPVKDTFGFNILLASYDVVLKDIEFLAKIEWEVLVLDEGHRIKNSKGKKNNALGNLPVRHRIILTGTPIQTTLAELWTHLRFVSPADFADDPEFLQDELENLTEETVLMTRNTIKPHLLRRSLLQAEHSIAPKEERVVFVGLTQCQRDIIRLIKLHKLWRLRGVQTNDEEEKIDSANEGHAIFRVCSHPFLIPDAESYYA
jgi:SNF2 family DNA or RNA helicase